MIEPRKDHETGPGVTDVAGLGNRVAVLEVKLDGLATKVDKGFEQVDKRFERVEDELVEQRREMKVGFQRLDDRFERMQRYFLGAAVAIIVALLSAPHL